MGAQGARRVAFAVFLSASCLATLGCEKALFPPHADRTPYERYQVLHGQYRPAKELNALGGERPALRQRLQPLYTP